MSNSTTGFQGLTLVPVQMTSFAGVLTTSLPAGTVIAGILDPVNGVHRIFNPYTVGLQPQSGDAASKWLPQVGATGLVPTSVVDAYWAPVFQGDESGATYTAQTKYGQIGIPLVAGTSDTVNASSTQAS